MTMWDIIWRLVLLVGAPTATWWFATVVEDMTIERVGEARRMNRGAVYDQNPH